MPKYIINHLTSPFEAIEQNGTESLTQKVLAIWAIMISNKMTFQENLFQQQWSRECFYIHVLFVYQFKNLTRLNTFSV